MKKSLNNGEQPKATTLLKVSISCLSANKNKNSTVQIKIDISASKMHVQVKTTDTKVGWLHNYNVFQQALSAVICPTLFLFESITFAEFLSPSNSFQGGC